MDIVKNNAEALIEATRLERDCRDAILAEDACASLSASLEKLRNVPSEGLKRMDVNRWIAELVGAFNQCDKEEI